jgi:predicted metal-dependent phosphoesterase TrpH
MRKRILFHFHTQQSVDSNLLPQEIVEFAVENQIGILAPTDHNTIRGAREIKELAAEHGIETIIGAEYGSDHGDIIGLFLQDDAYSRNATEITQEIHAQGGLTILPHPYRSHHLTDEFLHSFDGIEVFNARVAEQLNRLAAELAGMLKKPTFYGADAHVREELGLVVAEVEIGKGEKLIDAVRKGLTPVSLTQTTPAMIYRSKMIASAKRGTPVGYLSSMAKMLSARIKGATL